MDRKSQVSEVIGAIVLIGILAFGVAGANKIVSDNRFIGDSETTIVYDLKYCDVNIPKNKVISFENKDQAYALGFKDAGCNK